MHAIRMFEWKLIELIEMKTEWKQCSSGSTVNFVFNSIKPLSFHSHWRSEWRNEGCLNESLRPSCGTFFRSSIRFTPFNQPQSGTLLRASSLISYLINFSQLALGFPFVTTRSINFTRSTTINTPFHFISFHLINSFGFSTSFIDLHIGTEAHFIQVNTVIISLPQFNWLHAIKLI